MAVGVHLVVVHEPMGPLPEGDVVLALTPAAFDAAAAAGRSPQCIDDLVERTAVLPLIVDHLRWQAAWFSAIDQRLGGSDGSALDSAQLFKSAVDSTIAAGLLLTAATRAVNATEITYVGRSGGDRPHPWRHSHLQHWPILGDEPLAAQLLPLIALELGVPCAGIRSAGRHLAGTGPTRRDARAWARPYVHIARTVDVRRMVSRRSSATLFLWTAGYGIGCAVERALEAGHRPVFLTRGGPTTRILDLVRPDPRVGPRITVAPDWREHGGMEPLLLAIDERSGVPGAGATLTTRLSTYLDVCRAVAVAAGLLRPELERRCVEEVHVANPSSVEEIAALRAAGAAGIRRTLEQHGDHVFPYGFWLLTELQQVDALAPSDRTVPADVAEDAVALGRGMPSIAAPSARIVELRRRGRRQAADGLDGGPIAYVPSLLAGDSVVLGSGNVEDAWYHRWQLELLCLMRDRPDDTFVWKAYPPADQAVDTIPEAIERLGAANVRYEVRPLLSVVHDIGRIISDFPSTAVFEAVHLGVPVLALGFHRILPFRARSVEQLRPIYRPVSSAAEALDEVRQFIDAPGDPWRIPTDAIV